MYSCKKCGYVYTPALPIKAMEHRCPKESYHYVTLKEVRS